MHKRPIPVLLATLLFLLPGFLFSSDVQPLPEERYFTFEKNASGIDVHFDVPAVPVTSEDGNETRLDFIGSGELPQPDGPSLPVYSRLVAVPNGMDLVVNNIQIEWENLGVNEVLDKRSPEDNFSIDPQNIDNLDYLYNNHVSVGNTFRWRDLRVAELNVLPVRRSQTSGKLETATSFDIDLGFVQSNELDGFDPPGVSEALLPLYTEYVANALDEIDVEEMSRGTYLIIVPSLWDHNVDLLARWRTRTGFNVIVTTTDETGVSFNSIKTYIENIYETVTPTLDYVVLVSDIDAPGFIATNYVSPGVPNPYDPNIATDHKYTYDLTLGNHYQNVLPRYLIGRLSVDNATEALTVVKKVLQYEREPMTGNSARWTKALLAADASTAFSVEQTQKWVGHKMNSNGFTNVQEIFHNEFNNPPSTALSNAINDGVSWVAYRGFGGYQYWTGNHWQWFTSYDVGNLRNTNNLPVVTSMVCGGGAFDEQNENFGEVWIRAGSPNNLKGAVAFVGPSEIDTHTRWNNFILGAWYNSMFDQGLRTLGQCLLSSKMQLYRNYPLLWNAEGSNETSVWFYFHCYNILGDPALQLRIETPKNVTVLHAPNFDENTTHFTVTATYDGTGQPVEGAWVVITHNETEILGSGITGQNGTINLEVNVDVELENVELTVSRPDILPYTTDLVIRRDYGLEFASFSMVEVESDANTTVDNVLLPGELFTPEASFDVTNISELENLNVSVTVPEGLGEVVVGEESLGSFTTSESFTLSTPQIRISNNVEDGTRIPVTFDFSASEFFQSHLYVYDAVAAPHVTIEEPVFDQEWTPGTTAQLSLTLGNDNADLNAGSVTAQLSIEDPYVVVLDDSSHWSDLGADATGVTPDYSFTLQADEEVYPGHVVKGEVLFITSDGYQQHRQIEFEVAGAGPNTPTGPVGPGYYMYEDADTGYVYTPDFEYESIVGMDGAINLGIQDFGYDHDRDQTDQTVLTDLPFSFPYWDDYYTEISVCSNGWISFGETDLFFFRNRPLPSPLSPDGAILANWDDLIVQYSNSGVYAYHDEENGWYTVEWYNMKNYNRAGSNINFQIRLFDPEVHDTPGGLGQVAILYNTVYNMNSGENFLTAGITSPDGKEALQYEFANVEAATANGVENGRQILIAAGQGSTLTPPNFEISPGEIQINASTNSTGTTVLNITNTGGQTGRFHLTAEGINADWGVGQGSDIDEQGGPDGYGYRWYDSHESYGPTFEWVDIETEENIIPMTGGDNSGNASISESIDLSFNFPLYDDFYDSFWICESGYITFMAPGNSGNSANSVIPRSYSPRSSIFAYWDNVGINESGTIYAAEVNGYMVVSWVGITHHLWSENDGPYSFQIIFTSDGAIQMNYLEMNGRIDSATIGIQNETGDTGLQISLNAETGELLEDEFAIRIVPGLHWLSVNPSTAGVPGGRTLSVSLNADASDMPIGHYSGRLLLEAPITGQYLSIPLDFYVVEGALGYAPNIVSLPSEAVGDDGLFTSFNLDPYVEDWDNLDSELSWTTYNDDGLDITINEERQVSIEATDEWSGESIVTFKVEDPSHNVNEKVTRFFRGEGNNDPRFDTASPDYVGQITPGTQIHFEATVSDPEDEAVSLSWYHGQIGIGTGSSVDVTFNSNGPDTVFVVAEDESGNLSRIYWSSLVFVSDIESPGSVLPREFALETLYPNPFNAEMVIRYALPRTSPVEVTVYNLLGQQVARHLMGSVPAGRHEMTLNAHDWSSGIYFVSWKAGNITDVKKAVLMK